MTDAELRSIKKRVRRMPFRRKTELEAQVRFHGTCIFYDLDNNHCGIYETRPEVCRKFGYHNNLVCPFAPSVATNRDWDPSRDYVGLLSVDFTWKDFK